MAEGVKGLLTTHTGGGFVRPPAKSRKELSREAAKEQRRARLLAAFADPENWGLSHGEVFDRTGIKHTPAWQALGKAGSPERAAFYREVSDRVFELAGAHTAGVVRETVAAAMAGDVHAQRLFYQFIVERANALRQQQPVVNIGGDHRQLTVVFGTNPPEVDDEEAND